MPEIDFLDTQTASDDSRDAARRVRDMAGLAGVLAGVYAACLVGLVIENPLVLVAYLAGVTVVIVAVRRIAAFAAWLRQALSQHRRFAWGLVVAMLAAYPMIFVDDPYLIHIGALAGIFAVMALGLNITLGLAGLLDVGFAVYFAAGAYTSAQLATIFGVDFWIGLPLGGLVAAIFGFCVAWPALRVQGHYLAMVTLGYGLIMNILHRNLRGVTNGTDGVINIPPPAIGGHEFIDAITVFGLELPFQANFYYLAVVLTGFAFLVNVRLRDSNLGRCWEAIREDQVAAQCFAIDLTWLKVLAFSTGAFFGGLGGATFAHMIGFIHPDNFILLTSITVLAMVLIGGMGNPFGVVVGAVLLILIPERLREFENLRLLLFGGAMALIMIYRPQGLFPGTRRRRLLEKAKMEKLIEESGKADAHVRPVN